MKSLVIFIFLYIVLEEGTGDFVSPIDPKDLPVVLVWQSNLNSLRLIKINKFRIEIFFIHI